MNLYTSAGGLFGTHVTWEDIEEDMQRELDTVALFGLNKTAKNIGDGNGFMSRMVLIDPDWQHKDKVLPERFVVKILTQLALQQHVENIAKEKNIVNSLNSEEKMIAIEHNQKKCHNTEVTVYSHLQKLPEAKIQHAKIYHMKKFTEYNPVKGYIIMEYLDNKPIHVYDNVSLAAVKQVLRSKAAIEVASLKFTQEEKEMFTENLFGDFFSHVYTKETIDAMMLLFRMFTGDKLAYEVGQIEGILADLVNLPWADQLADELGMQRVLCHGDLWSMNILWKTNGNDVDLAAVVDYQTAHMGCPANDLVRLFCSCLSGKDRQKHWEELLEEFYGYIEEDAAGMALPYSLEQLKESYRRFLPLGGFMVLTMIPSLFEPVNKSTDEEGKKKCLDAAMEKIEHLLHDVLHYHERNMKLKNGEQVA